LAAVTTNIATFCGFTSLGRFSVVYGRPYGQSPSQTLRQAPAPAGSVRGERSRIGALCSHRRSGPPDPDSIL